MTEARDLTSIRFLIDGGDDDPVAVVKSRFWSYNAIGFWSGGEACVVDPGIYPDEIEALDHAVCTRGRTGPPRQVTHVVITHSHHDHIRGWMRFPGARVVLPNAAAEKGEGPRTRILATKSKIDDLLAIDDPEYRYPEADEVFDDRHHLRIGDLDVELRFLPGHSSCTSVVWIPELRTLCTADYLVSPGLPYCRWKAGPFEQAIETLREWVAEDGVERILPAHNDAIVGRTAIEAALDEERDYFLFLRERVRDAIAEGHSREDCIRGPAREATKRRGEDVGRKDRQDYDNAKRVVDEEWPED